jgi:hypothetical protein
MPRIVKLVIAAVVTALGCAAPHHEDRPAAPGDSTHDPALHAAHTAGARSAAAAPSPAAPGASDSTFAAMQARGAMGMGVDQYTSTHTFEPRPDGGRITLRRDVADTAGVERIRAHLAGIATAFAAGDFKTPGFVHAEAVPGTDVMAARRSLIRYRSAPIDRGAELVMTTSDSLSLDAIHRFLAYQRREHRAGGGER